MEKELQLFLGKLDKRFDKIDHRIELLESKLDQRFDNVDHGIDGLSRLSKNEFEKVHDQMEQFDNRLKGTTRRIDDLDQNKASISSFQALDERLENLETN